MYRLFVAVDLPEEIRTEAADIAKTLQGGRRVPQEQLHLTLRFIGEADDKTLHAVKAALKEILGHSFPLVLRGLGHFPPRGLPRVLWVGIEESVPLRELQRSVELALIGAGIPPEERRFSPHLTLARLKDTPPGKVQALEQHNRDFRAGPFLVTEFHLYSSTLTREGAIHTVAATYPLTAGQM